jgi:hypothetical protein
MFISNESEKFVKKQKERKKELIIIKKSFIHILQIFHNTNITSLKKSTIFPLPLFLGNKKMQKKKKKN